MWTWPLGKVGALKEQWAHSTITLHNQSTILLRSALRAQGSRVVKTVGFYV
jgi:hypothetical protein